MREPLEPRRTGIREAKARLGRMISDVRNGREWVITDRGKPVARLVPVTDEFLELEDWVARMEDEGVIETPSGTQQPLPPPLPGPVGWAQRHLQAESRPEAELLTFDERLLEAARGERLST